MNYVINDVVYKVEIKRKDNKNLYIRIKDKNTIVVTCNYFITDKMVLKALEENYKNLQKMVNKIPKRIISENKLFYLGKSYDIILDEKCCNISIQDNKIYAKNKLMLDKWYKDEIIRIFDDRYIVTFNKFKENIKSPILKIRTMKTRWGVYNRKNHSITLNSKLIEFDYDKIDYVIIHELSHIIHFDHSKQFWELVSKYCSDYKKIRKEMNG